MSKKTDLARALAEFLKQQSATKPVAQPSDEDKKRIAAEEQHLQRLRVTIVAQLRARNSYEESDDALIDELLFQYRLMNEAKADIALRGIQINVRVEGEPLFQKNHSVSVVEKCVRTIQSIFSSASYQSSRPVETQRRE
jgi:hypothetical protein